MSMWVEPGCVVFCLAVTYDVGYYGSEPCVFPFVSRGKTYHSCTTKHGRDSRGKTMWCAVSWNYEQGKKRGNCYKPMYRKLYFLSQAFHFQEPLNTKKRMLLYVCYSPPIC